MNSETILENLQTAILLIDEQGMVRSANMAAETLFTLSRRRLIGTKLVDLIPDRAFQSRVVDCWNDSSLYTLRELEIPLNEKSVLVDLTLSPVGHESTGGAAVLIEINSIHRISRFMHEKNQIERQQAFRLMMRGLAHEIKNPLGGIRGAAQLLGREVDDVEQQELTEILIKEADRLTRLVDRVMGSREQLRLEAMNAHDMLEHVVELVTVKFEQPLLIERVYDPTLPEIEADREQLIQAMLNIVGNAIESQRDVVTPRLGLITEFDRMVTINQVTYRQVLKIKVWDEGPGVPKELQEIIFDPLITNRAEGTGLGLSITQEIVQRHKGVVQLEEHLGKTCFTVYLPYIDAGTE